MPAFNTRPCGLFIFDLDGTLVDSQQDIVHALNLALKRMLLPAIASARIGTFVGDGVQKLVERALGDVMEAPPDAQALEQGLRLFQEEYHHHFLDHTRLYPHAGRALDLLRWASFAVVSNKQEVFCRGILEGLGVADRFSIIVGGDSVEHRKPHPEPLLKAMRACSIAPSLTAMVGDSLVDIQAGKAAGAVTVGVLGGFRPEAELASSGCDLLIRSLTELAAHFHSAGRS